MERELVQLIHPFDKEVSILVMLEVKWKDFLDELLLDIFPSFNPCYVGSKMESEIKQLQLKKKALFQSLLCWK